MDKRANGGDGDEDEAYVQLEQFEKLYDGKLGLCWAL